MIENEFKCSTWAKHSYTSTDTHEYTVKCILNIAQQSKWSRKHKISKGVNMLMCCAFSHITQPDCD